jgi:hypothetical protein
MSVWHKVVLVVALVLAALVGRPANGLTIGLVAFGAANVLLSVPETLWVTIAAIAATFIALLLPASNGWLIAIGIWLVWPPAFMLAWTRRRRPASLADSGTRARVTVAVVIVAVALASVAYRMFLGHGLQQTAALFLGIPTILALVVVFGFSPRSAIGVAYKAVTVGLLVSLLFLGEGVLCVMMSAPLFFGIATAVVALMDLAESRRHTPLSCLAVLLLVPMSLEGVTDLTSFGRDELVTETRLVQAPADEVERALRREPRFDRAVPGVLRAGFPRPVASRIEVRDGTSWWIVRMRGGETRLNGMEPRAGDLVLRLVDATPGRFRWRAVSDDSHMTHFLNWRESVVEWTPAGPDATRVTWTIRYRRGLDPAWYFGPLERYAARLAAGYLIESVATP